MICTRRLFPPSLAPGRLVICALALAVSATAAPRSASASDYGTPRQYYSEWHQQQGGSYYRHYYYKPTADFVGYKHHYVMLYPSHPDRCYYYNPYKKTYWGYCPSSYSEGEPAYSHLSAEYQKSDLSQIPDSAFPAPGALPPIPESKDGTRLDLPPDDVPPGFSTQRPGNQVPR